MICLTGDVHHPMGYVGQSYFEGSEASLSYHYLKIVQKYGLKATLFITGKTFKKNRKEVERLLTFDNLEIGGHTWSALRPRWLHYRIFRKLTGSSYGPRLYQKLDIIRTVNVIHQVTNEYPISWRTHGYSSDAKTFEILANKGIRVISDEVSNEKYNPSYFHNDLISLPINVLPDHEHLYHAERDKEHVQREIEGGWKDAFTAKSFYIDRYFEIIKSQIEEIEDNNGITTILLHPSCMKIADDFTTFEKLCRWINKKGYNTLWCKEVIKHM